MTDASKDVWAAGNAYEPYVGRWSRLVAREFLDWIDAKPDQVWLDIGCGTGALSQAILDRAAPARITGIDPSQGFVDHAKAHVRDARASFRTGDAQSIPADEDAANVVVSGLVLNFIPDIPRAVSEMKRIVKSRGIVAAYVWDYAGEMQLMRHFWNAAVALDPAARVLDEGNRFPICQLDRLRDLFAGQGFEGVDVRAIDVPTVFTDFDDYWRPFLGGQGPAPGYCMSLPPERREGLRDHIRAGLPIGADGRIALIARAFAVRGNRP